MAEKISFWQRLIKGLTKTRDNFIKSMDYIFNGFTNIDDDFYEELEEVLIMGDIGVRTTEQILDDLRDAVEEKTRDEHDENKTDEKIVEEAAVELSKESDDLEDPDDPSNDDEPEHVHGTPWGNPNTLY